jgi:hypothetical protein
MEKMPAAVCTSELSLMLDNGQRRAKEQRGGGESQRRMVVEHLVPLIVSDWTEEPHDS